MNKQVDNSWMIEGQYCWVDMDQFQQYQQILENEGQSMSFIEKQSLKKDKKKESETIYQKAIIESIEKDSVGLYIESDKLRIDVPLEMAYELNQDLGKVYPDMVDMEVLNEPEILSNIRKYYKSDQIFSKIGPTLIVVNPYKYIPELFSDQVFETIRNDSQKPNFDFSNALPHVWSIAANSYQSLFAEKRNQAIVISGESGAGKTENTKFAMKFLTSLSENRNLFVISEQESESSIEERILRCNPILEAFGNAKTVRNDNSSRFGKYVRIWIDGESQKIQGASISKYLLEKSRVTSISNGERNYHIFYHFLRSGKDLQEKYGIKEEPEMYKYLQSDCINVGGVKDAELFEQMVKSFQKMGFTQQEEEAIYNMVAAILHLGNVEFDDSSLSDTDPCGISQETKENLQFAGKLLGVQEEQLAKCIVLKVRQVGQQVIESPLKKQDCETYRDSFAKALYDKLFDWLISKLNLGIQPEGQQEQNQLLSLGLLDIFGFENFEVNSFEQLCINFTNEKLQQLYIEYVFKSEKKEFIAEGLEEQISQGLTFKDNQELIDLIEKKRVGILELLDESCSLGNSTDQGFLGKIQQNHSGNECFVEKKIKSQTTFTIRHTAKDVEYNVEGFRQKNLDEVVQVQQNTIQNSQNKQMKNIWNNFVQQQQQDGVENPEQQLQSNKGIKSKSDKYLGAKFRNQMEELMGELQQCGVHFIRCLKPNEQKQKGAFSQRFVMQQIKYLGLLESVKVRKQGYPFRYHYNQFYEKYKELNRKYRSVAIGNIENNVQQVCKDICEGVFSGFEQKKENDILFGSNKIYMRFECSQFLSEQFKIWHKEREQMVKKIQKQGKVYVVRRTIFENLQKIKQAIKKFVKVQACYRRKVQYKKYNLYKNVNRGAQQCKQVIDKISLQKGFEKYQLQVRLKIKQLKEQEQKLKEEKERQQKIMQQKIQESLQKLKESQRLSQEREREKKEQEEKVKEQQKQEEEDQEYERYLALQQEKKKQAMEVKRKEREEQEKQEMVILMEKQREQGDQFTYNEKNLRLWDKRHEQRQNDQAILLKSGKMDNKVQQKSIQSDSRDRVPSFINVVQGQQSKEATYTLKDYSSKFIKTIKENDFLEFCGGFVVKGANFGKKDTIKKIMSFSKDSLKQPLSRVSDYSKEADLIFRSILKIGGNRRSRFPLQFHQSNCICVCLGHDTLEGQEEANFYSNYQNQLAQKQANYGQNLAKKYNSNVLVPSDKQNINAQQVILMMINQIMSNKYAGIRDELYFQICKQVEGNSSEGTNKLYKFFNLCLNMFVPSYSVMWPLLNFFYQKSENEKRSENRKEATFLFNKLAKIMQSYLIIKDIPFQISKDLVSSSQIYNQDPVSNYLAQQPDGSFISFEFLEEHISVVKSRNMIPVKEEQKLIGEKQQCVVDIHMFSSYKDCVSVPCPSYKTVFQVKNQVARDLGMRDMQHNFGLYQIKYFNEGQIHEEGFLEDEKKILDIISLHRNQEQHFIQEKNQVLNCKIYFKIRNNYYFDEMDFDTVKLQYYQCLFDYKRGKYIINTIDMAYLIALEIMVQYGPNSKDAIKLIKSNIKKFLPDTKKTSYMTMDRWANTTLQKYKDFVFVSQSHTMFQFLDFFRKYDQFMGHIQEGKMYTVKLTEEGYAKSKEPQQIRLIFRPLHIVIQNNMDHSTLKVIEYEEVNSWGKSVGVVSQYFYIKLQDGDMYIFSLSNLFWPDFMLNNYVHGYMQSEQFAEKNCKFQDILSFLLSNLQDQELDQDITHQQPQPV